MSIAHVGGISVGPATVGSGTVVRFDPDGAGTLPSVEIGSLSGLDSDNLTVSLNSGATDAAVQALAQALRFSSSDATEDVRTVSITLNDGNGTANGGDNVTSIAATVTVGSKRRAGGRQRHHLRPSQLHRPGQ